MLVLGISSSTLSGHFGFNSDTQTAQQGFQTDVQKREHIYFQAILWATAILALVRYFQLVTVLIAGSLDVCFISLSLVFCSVAGRSRGGEGDGVYGCMGFEGLKGISFI